MLKLTPPDDSGRVLLHSCCAPCSSAIIECMLENGLRPTVFYFNPNIFPREEYEIRKQEAVRFVTAQGLDLEAGGRPLRHRPGAGLCGCRL